MPNAERIGEYRFLLAEEVPPGAMLRYSGVIPFVSFLVFAMLVVVPVVAAFLIVASSFRPRPCEPPDRPDPASVQRRYDRTLPYGILMAVLGLLPLLMFVLPRRMVVEAYRLHALIVPGVSSGGVVVLALIPMVLGLAILFSAWNGKRLQRHAGALAEDR